MIATAGYDCGGKKQRTARVEARRKRIFVQPKHIYVLSVFQENECKSGSEFDVCTSLPLPTTIEAMAASTFPWSVIPGHEY